MAKKATKKEVKIIDGNEVFRSRAMCLMLYEEDETHRKAMDIIAESGYNYACICHDADVEDDGVTVKKPHYHYVIRFRNGQWSSALASDLGIKHNYIQKCKSVDYALLYLIHFNDMNKFQYDVDDVQGNLKARLSELVNMNEKGECEKVNDLIAYIDNSIGLIRTKDFSKFCADNGYWAEYRRSASIFHRIIDEHNSKYMGVSNDVSK